jgi:hypothetical protein
MIKMIKKLVNTDNPFVLGMAGGLLCAIIIPPLFYYHKDAFGHLPEQTERAYVITALATTVPGLFASRSGKNHIITTAWIYFERFSARSGVSTMSGLNDDISRTVRTLHLTLTYGAADKSNRRRSG